MKFTLTAAERYFHGFDGMQVLKDLGFIFKETSPGYFLRDSQSTIEINSLVELHALYKKVDERLVVDFELMVITIYDGYLE